MYVYMYACVYIYIYREREREIYDMPRRRARRRPFCSDDLVPRDVTEPVRDGLRNLLRVEVRCYLSCVRCLARKTPDATPCRTSTPMPVFRAHIVGNT